MLTAVSASTTTVGLSTPLNLPCILHQNHQLLLLYLPSSPPELVHAIITCGSVLTSSCVADGSGVLMKKGDRGMFANEYRTRYFVLAGARLYYFNSWEDYGSMGLQAAKNYSAPIRVSAVIRRRSCELDC